MWAFIALAVIGVILVITGGVLIPVFHKVIHNKIEKGVMLKNDSDAFHTWRDPPAKVYMNFYVYDIVNRAEIMKNGSKPVLEQKGPYVYEEIRNKEKVHFSANGTLLSYMETKSYVFVPSKSNGSETDKFTGLNLLFVSFPTSFQYFISYMLSITDEELMQEFSVESYIFGYEDHLLKKFQDFCLKIFKRKCSLIEDRVGLFATGNGTADGVYSIHTGSDNISSISSIETWNGNRTLNFWNTSYCNMINGSVGTDWHPFIEDDERLYLFSSDICRSIYLTKTSAYSLNDKIHVKRFSPPADVFADPRENPDNRGFCTGKCLKAGVIDVRKCKSGIPVVMSLPHFFNGDKEYQTDVIGMKPDEKKHQTLIDVEPLTGAVFNARKRLQINMRITHSNVVSASKKLKDGIIFPLLWLEEEATITNTGVDDFVKQVYRPMKMTTAIHWGILGLGVLLLLVAIVVIIVIVSRRKKDGSERSDLITHVDEGDQ
ncbi:hypothetical protein CAPTEDRAFT_178424 [Capitella teleta]|uniref:Platelet glycoprotein 4 n=1 Tax=Capitella teleta TaxID=283909 RepID=R7T6Y7_CAPTE|nr:hypothetical protein CAPTEDRAFT_178424 [Capitella teleta]|eukprot:ELT89305.1 hypothetical protein CAPTEDRAFT_178424 [Capitella teleta]